MLFLCMCDGREILRAAHELATVAEGTNGEGNGAEESKPAVESIDIPPSRTAGPSLQDGGRALAGARIAGLGSEPGDVEAGDSRLLAEDTPDETVDVLGRIGCHDSTGGCGFVERSVVLGLEDGVAVFSIDVVTDANEFLVGVRAGEEDHGDADEVGGRDARGKGSCCLEESPAHHQLLLLLPLLPGTERTSNSNVLTPTGTGPTMHVSSS